MSSELVRRALEQRGELLARLHREDTDCYRLFHGAAEGRPGLTIDRYGPVLLLQTWREPLSASETDAYARVVSDALGVSLTPVWNHRASRGTEAWEERETPVGRELGIRYAVTPRHRGPDPLLFLDLRAGRRLVLARARGRSVLNLFAYTGGVSLAAVRAGATDVWHVDFARSSMEWTRTNLELNDIGPDRVRLVREDAIPVVRQLADLPVKGRGARRRDFERFAPRSFDLVVLDPPRWATGPFGAVDVVRDYPSLLKPALLATPAGGALLITNNAPRVERREWLRIVERTAEKCGRTLTSLETIEPEVDFPFAEEEPPLKMAWLELE